MVVVAGLWEIMFGVGMLWKVMVGVGSCEE